MAIKYSPSPAERLRTIFMPGAAKRSRELDGRGAGRFAYYTTAATAYLILKNREVWLHSAAVMNDATEIEHGLHGVQQVLKGDEGQRLFEAMDNLFVGAAESLRTSFEGWAPHFRRTTYVLCVSVHTTSDDDFGKLSMWRAYGKNAGVAFVFNGKKAFPLEIGELGAYALPVTYGGTAHIRKSVMTTVNRIKKNAGWLRRLGPQTLVANAFHMLRFLSVTTKHRGFEEEKEWRVIVSPAMEASPILNQSVESINGVPQIVQKLSLRYYKSVRLNLRFQNILDRVIVGPCDDPQAIKAALHMQLAATGVRNAGSKVSVSNIPLRHQPHG